jgi:xanthosine utilization system XapX-like protein
MQGGGIIGAIAGMLAGIVELAMLGAIFAVVGGRPGESVLGAVAGLLAGLAFALVRVPAPVVMVANFGMVVGAIAGATLRPYLRLLSLPFVALGRLIRRRQRPAVVNAGPDGLKRHRPVHCVPHAQREVDYPLPPA